MCPMIVCVAGNPSIDKLFEVAEVVIGEIHRPDRMISLPGGKGIHVAQVATLLGAEAVVTGLLAGHTGRWVAQALAAEGVTGEWVWGAGETRSSLSVADSATGRLTEFYESATAVSGAEWGAVRSIVDSLMPAADWIVLAGSLPEGANGYAPLVESAQSHNVRCAVDSRGRALAEAIDAGADLVKINIHEAGEVLGAEFHGPADAIRAARAIRDRAGGDGHAVAITLGEDGMVGVDFERRRLARHARRPRPLSGRQRRLVPGGAPGRFRAGELVGAGVRAGARDRGRQRGAAGGRSVGPRAGAGARCARGRQRCVRVAPASAVRGRVGRGRRVGAGARGRVGGREPAR